MEIEVNEKDVLIVGGGHAGAQAAIALRQHGFTGSIDIVSEEADLPYERPPLSKDYLAGEKAFERLLIRPAVFWRERQIDVHLKTRVVRVDAQAHWAETESGQKLSYRRLIWAAGGRARALVCDGSELERVHAVRSRADVDRMVAELPSVQEIVVIGGGFIGLEVAAVLTRIGKQVTLLEVADRVLARVAGEPISSFYEAEHRAHGVQLRTGVRVECIEGRGGAAVGVRLEGGEIVNADLIIVGIGITASVEPLIAAGAAGTDGVDVDEFCRTSLRDVFAIGDCAAHVNRFAQGRRIRLESVQNATDQATTAARAIAGNPLPYRAVPWFWSNQYDLKLQTVGIAAGFDDHVVRGDPSEKRFSTIYLREGRVIALDCVNSVKDYVQGRALVEQGALLSKVELADTSVSLKQLVPRAAVNEAS